MVTEDGQLLPAPRNLPQELFIDFERQDNEQILAELRGEVIEEYAYQFQQGGQTITGLSLAGVMAVAQQMGGITCGQPVWTVTDDEIVCDISATDHKTGNTVWATASEPRVMQTKNGPKPDKFARAKALSKAQRNAIHKLIPAALATKMLELAIGQTKGQRRREPSRQAKPAISDAAPEPMPEQDAEFREIESPPRMTDDQFQAIRRRANTWLINWPDVVSYSGRMFGGRQPYELTFEEGKRLVHWMELQRKGEKQGDDQPAQQPQAALPIEPDAPAFDPDTDADLMDVE